MAAPEIGKGSFVYIQYGWTGIYAWPALKTNGLSNLVHFVVC